MMNLPTLFRRWIERGLSRLSRRERRCDSRAIDRRKKRACPPYTARGAWRRAFTLAEILLTLAILVIVTALVWPTVQNSLAGRRLQTAVDSVRTEWCQARVEAMRSGRTYAFRYIVGGDRYHLGPQDASGSGTSALPAQGDDSSGATASSPGSVSPPASNAAAEPSTAGNDQSDMPVEGEPTLVEEKSLPDGVHFVTGETSDSSLASSAGGDTQSLDGSGDAWSDPVLFYPDGTTSNARLVLAGKRGGAMRLELRGITGTVTVSDTASLE